MLGSKKFRYITSELLHRDLEDCIIPKRIKLPTEAKIIQIASGENHTLFLTGSFIEHLENGEMYGIGGNESGELDGKEIHHRNSEYMAIKIPLKVKGKIMKVKTGNIRSCAITDAGEVWYWGGEKFIKDNKRDEPFKLLNTEIMGFTKSGEKLVDFAMGYGHDVMLTEHEE